MSLVPVTERVVHSALEERVGAPPGSAALTDRQRMAVLLQGSALLGHLSRAGWCLEGGWEDARIDGRAALGSVRAMPGRSRDLVQDEIRRLLVLLFEGAGARPAGSSGTMVERREVRTRTCGRRLAGRGHARRLARRLLHVCDQRLSPMRPDRIVEYLLDKAEFLWLPEYASAREALVAEHRTVGGRRSTVVGRWSFAARLRSSASNLVGLRRELRTERARDHWLGEVDGRDPVDLVESGRYGEAVEGWRREPPTSGAERIELARALQHLARYEEALAELSDLTSASAGVLVANCLRHLGRPRSARRALDRVLSRRLSKPDRDLALDIGLDLEGRLAGGRAGSRSGSGRRVGRDSGRRRSRLHRAEAAWARRDLKELSRRLQDSTLGEDPRGESWRWRRLRALAVLERGDLAQADAGLRRALGANRRALDRIEAAGLWREVGQARARAGDLPGAERALHQGVRLLRDLGSGRGASPVWQSLVEIRLRLGRLEGAERYLDEAAALAENGGDLGSVVRVAGLRVRLLLAQGRPGEALAQARESLARIDLDSTPRSVVHVDGWLLELLAARALGWLGRTDASQRALAACDERAWCRLDSEERSLSWLVAGDRERAQQAAPQNSIGHLIRRLARGRRPSAATWRALECLPTFGAARLVFDLAIGLPGSVPGEWVRRAAAELRRTGAEAWARRLEIAEFGPWQALRAYAESRRPPSLEELFVACGAPEARLVWTDGSGEIEIVPGSGGVVERTADLAGGCLTLTAHRLDEPLEALFALACRDFRPPRVRDGIAGDRADGILGSDPGFRAALERVQRLAVTDLPLLVEGESGTGKELVVRRAHAASGRRDSPFLALNCAALPDSLLLADLFGHVRGAFTGADRDRKGVFESAAGGTVLLDEIGDLPKAAQGKLLRVLQEGEVRRVGESRPRKVDVRVMAATHRSLTEMVRSGGFRGDLYYRLRVGSVALPPLRDRGEDVLLLADSFLAEHGLVLGPRARRALANYRWPGNIRELRNVLDVAAAMAEGRSVGFADLDLPDVDTPADDGELGSGYHAQVEAFRRGLVERALDESRGVRARAARRLGLSRQAISYLAKRFGID